MFANRDELFAENPRDAAGFVAERWQVYEVSRRQHLATTRAFCTSFAQLRRVHHVLHGVDNRTK